MKKHFIYILLLTVSVNSFSQVIDTTRKINTWKLMHNYSRFEDADLDTLIYDLHKDFNPVERTDFAWERAGGPGKAIQNIDFFNRQSSKDFFFGNSYVPYMATPDNTKFFNTKTPYTEIVYSLIPNANSGDETIKFLHSQNMDAYSNISGELEVLSADDYFEDEESRTTKFSVFGNRRKNKYSAFGVVNYNKFANKENGGLSNYNTFLNSVDTDPRFSDMKLSNAVLGFTSLKGLFTQNFEIEKKVSQSDSLGNITVTGRNISFNHQLFVERNVFQYQDEAVNSGIALGFYPEFNYFDISNTKDSVVQDNISNTFQFILGDPYTDKLSARIYAGHEFYRYGHRAPDQFQVFSKFDTLSKDPLVLDSVFKDTAAISFIKDFSNEIFLGFHLAGPPENLWYWNVDAKYYVLGYQRNNLSANATFSRQIFKDYRFGLKGSIQNINPSYYYNNYSSSFFSWQKDFKATQLLKGEAFLTSKEKRMDASFSAGMFTNYLYWDQNAAPAQHDEIIYIFSSKLFKHFKFSGFNSIHQILFQYATGNDVLHLPLVAYKTTNYWERDFFKNVLKLQIGVDLFITSKYKANAYMPVTGVFYLQDNQVVGQFPFVDAYAGIRIKRTRLFLSYNNGLADILSRNYFTLADYPIRPAYLRFGVAWTFYD